MPFYEYQCSRCGHHHEELQRIADKPLRKCPECGRASLTRMMSAPVFRLKGGGWYETDFKSEKESKRNLAGEKEPAVGKADDKPAETKAAGEGKPATGTDQKAVTDEPAVDKPTVPLTTGRKPVASGSRGRKGKGKAAPRRRS